MTGTESRIIIDPDILAGKPVIRGTRISVELVIERLSRGWSADQVIMQYPHLAPADIQACLAYAAHLLQSERIYPVPA